MSVDWTGVEHVTKVDPAKPLPDRTGAICDSDLVFVGGSDDVTAQNTLATIEQLRDVAPALPICQEPYDADHVNRDIVEAVDGIAVAAIFNGDPDHFVGKHLDFFTELVTAPEQITGAGLPVVGDLVQSRGRDVVETITDALVPEAYVIQNPNSAAAEQTGADEPLSTDGVAGAALATEEYFSLPVFYVEYSGTYGGPEDVAAAAEQLSETTLLYGGGIDSQEKTEEILDAGADAVVVGDIFHADIDQYRQTIPES